MSNGRESLQHENDLKTILLGIQGVGKTNLIKIATGRKFEEEQNSTLSVSFFEKKIVIDKIEYKIDLWDTIGQENLRQLTKLFYNNSKIVIFVYDITNLKSFEELKSWHEEVIDQVGDDIIKGVVGNKMDLYDNEQVKEEQGKEFAKSIGAEYLSISAKTDPPKKFEDFLILLVKAYLKTGKLGNYSLKIGKDHFADNKNKNCCK